MYYAARLLSKQKNEYFYNDDYQDIREVYSIWIFHDPSKAMAGGITKYSIMETCIQGSSRLPQDTYDLLHVVHIYLTSYKGRDKGVNGMLATLLSNVSVEEKNAFCSTSTTSR